MAVNLGMALHQFDLVAVAGLDHAVRFSEGDGRRLFHDDMDAMLGRHHRVIGMIHVRRRDPDGVDFAAGVHLFDAVEGFAAVVFLFEFLDGVRAGVSTGG